MSILELFLYSFIRHYAIAKRSHAVLEIKQKVVYIYIYIYIKENHDNKIIINIKMGGLYSI